MYYPDTRIQVLSSLQAIRKRPAMYLGCTYLQDPSLPTRLVQESFCLTDQHHAVIEGTLTGCRILIGSAFNSRHVRVTLKGIWLKVIETQDGRITTGKIFTELFASRDATPKEACQLGITTLVALCRSFQVYSYLPNGTPYSQDIQAGVEVSPFQLAYASSTCAPNPSPPGPHILLSFELDSDILGDNTQVDPNAIRAFLKTRHPDVESQVFNIPQDPTM